MHLQQLILKNIRSYVDQTIVFKEGITLLSGDIGSGKSSILLAIEFALFGSSRPNLPAESLLRKGAISASVTLNFKLGQTQIQIKRNLKKEKSSIRQTNGHIIIGNQKLDLTPLELKAKMLELLCYPKDLVSKGKNFVYRYTIYCPQEDMKQILQDTIENRLNILRKLFGIEKYKNVRDNLQLYLRTLKKQITILKTRLEPFPDLTKDLLEFQTEQKKVQLETSSLATKLEEKRQQLDQSQKQLDLLESKQQQFQTLLTKQKQNTVLNEELLARKLSLETKILNQKNTLSSLIIDDNISFETLNTQIQTLESRANTFKTDLAKLETKISSLQSQMSNTKSKITDLSNSTDPSKISQITSKITEITNKLELNSNLDSKLSSLQISYQDLIKTKSSVSTKIAMHKQKISDVSSLNSCPTCLQTVPSEHKHKITQTTSSKLKDLTGELSLLQTKQDLLTTNLEQTKQQIIQMKSLTDQLNALKQENSLISQRKQLLDQLKTEFQTQISQNNDFMKTLSQMQSDKAIILPRIEQNLSRLNKIKQKLETKTHLEKQISSLNQEFSNITLRLTKISQDQTLISNQLTTFPNMSEKITLQKSSHGQIQTQTKSLYISHTQSSTNLKHLTAQISNLQTKLAKLTQTKQELLSTTERLNWLSSFFIPLTFTIEKELMLRIYHSFNELFQTCFSLLTQGSDLTSNLDSSFTPNVEQQGHNIPFSYLSGGERTAASLAYRLALNKTINDLVQQIKTKNILILDEPTEGFSSEQLNCLRDVLENLNLTQILIVSHEKSIEGFVNNIIRIEKQQGISHVV